MLRKICLVPESNQRHEDFQSSALPTELTGHWVAGIGFEPMTSGLWARRASRLLHPAIVFSYSIKSNGQRWIRTIEASCSRFTVCPLWPLGNLPIIQFNIKLYKADDRTRTDNLLITNQLLCQLSHIGIRLMTFNSAHCCAKNDSNGIWTRVTAVKGRCLNRLTMEPYQIGLHAPIKLPLLDSNQRHFG